MRQGPECTGEDVVWWDGEWESARCPVPYRPPHVDEAMWWFDLTHAPSEQGWAMVRLPGSGGVDVQDALLMQWLSTIRGTLNKIAAEHSKATDSEAR